MPDFRVFHGQILPVSEWKSKDYVLYSLYDRGVNFHFEVAIFDEIYNMHSNIRSWSWGLLKMAYSNKEKFKTLQSRHARLLFIK